MFCNKKNQLENGYMRGLGKNGYFSLTLESFVAYTVFLTPKILFGYKDFEFVVSEIYDFFF